MKFETEKPVRSLRCFHENSNRGRQVLCLQSNRSPVESFESCCPTSAHAPNPAKPIPRPTTPLTIIAALARMERLLKSISLFKMETCTADNDSRGIHNESTAMSFATSGAWFLAAHQPLKSTLIPTRSKLSAWSI